MQPGRRNTKGGNNSTELNFGTPPLFLCLRWSWLTHNYLVQALDEFKYLNRTPSSLTKKLSNLKSTHKEKYTIQEKGKKLLDMKLNQWDYWRNKQKTKYHPRLCFIAWVKTTELLSNSTPSQVPFTHLWEEGIYWTAKWYKSIEKSWIKLQVSLHIFWPVKK